MGEPLGKLASFCFPCGVASRMIPAVFVTGTDTGIGKTVASVALLHALRTQGLRAVGMKPVASGCDETPAGLRNDDALALQQASDPQPAYADVNPIALPDPTTPELAAAFAGATIALAPIRAAFDRLRGLSDIVVVEGAGGWLAPWSPTLEQSDLVAALDLPVVLVVGLRLGGISHARLTARAIRADGARLIGWIGNRIDPQQRHPAENLAILTRCIDAPCLGILPWSDAPQAPANVTTITLEPLRSA
jgi:dethiobiotin synthetase